MKQVTIRNRNAADSNFEQVILSVIPTLYSSDVALIIQRYNEPWRHYHNEQHILNMLRIVDEVIPPAILSKRDAQRLRAAIIFHDVEYKLNREPGWNERQSAEFARECLERAKVDEDFILDVEVGIISTISHSLETVSKLLHRMVGILIDADLLAGLGTNYEEFNFNTVHIGTEYNPLYTIPEYHAGRKKWAEKMLNREKIFLTDWFAIHEEEARKNLQRCIDS